MKTISLLEPINLKILHKVHNLLLFEENNLNKWQIEHHNTMELNILQVSGASFFYNIIKQHKNNLIS